MDRRSFMKIVGGASGAAAVGSCGVDKGTEYLIPYLVPPEEEIVPGEAVYYNTTCTECPAACGVRAKVRNGFPVKLEGLDGHPVSDGALCVRGQASITRLYHPDRVTGPLARNDSGGFDGIGWDEAGARIARAIEQAREDGSGILYLPSHRSGVSSEVINLFCRRTTARRLHDFELYSHSAIREANSALFGRYELPHYAIGEADLLITVGADIIETFASPVSHAVGLKRAKERPGFRWLHLEPHLSLTGLQADERLVLHPGSEAHLLLHLLRYLISRQEHRRRLPADLFDMVQRTPAGDAPAQTGLSRETLDSVARALARSRKPLLIVGGVSTGHLRGLEAAFLGGLIQWLTGAFESTVRFSYTGGGSRAGSMRDLGRLCEQLEDHGAGVLFFAAANPVRLYSDPEGLREALGKVGLKVALTSLLDETARQCDIVLPLSHYLESWGELEPREGVHSIIQPALDPLGDTRSEGDILLGLMRTTSDVKRRRTFQAYLFDSLGGPRPRGFVEELIERGYAGGPMVSSDVSIATDTAGPFLEDMELRPGIKRPILVVAPSVRGFDGRSAELPLLREIPDPVTTISYGRWLAVSDSEAGRLSLEDGDEIEASLGRFSLRLPVKVHGRMPEGIYGVHRDILDEYPAGFDPRTGEQYACVQGSAFSKTGASIELPVMSASMSQDGRGIIPRPNHREAGRHGHGPRPNMYPAVEHETHRWAMAIDLDKCIGCAACVAACYIENNVPVVGLEEHLKGRELSWLRVEPFYEEDGRGRIEFVPMLCQHCTYAPCETVCPVYAAYHNPEGLNAQIYNRCVGTRYCSNNCPYKVRRFNWFTYKRPSPTDKMLNPDVFVRGKGVMEKCTFCIQRIRAAHDRAKDESRPIRDGDVMTACQQACPTGAIVFGDLLDESSRVYDLAHSDRAYTIFESLGTEPGVYYLGRRDRPHTS